MAVSISKKQIMFGSIILLILAIGAAIAIFLINGSRAAPLSSDNPRPSFSLVLPSNKSADSLGGVSLVSPEGASPVYAYADTINTVGITVSQQELPAAFKADVDKNIEQLAKQDNANRTIKAGETTVFVGKSVKGPQSLYFAKNDLLILVKSQNEISDADWIQYITSLKKV